jgi:hypothetical protein
MKIIRSKFLRLFGQKYIILPWAVYAAPKAKILENDLSHEAIHMAQWRELFIIGFLFWYIIEWLIRVVIYTLQWIINGCKKGAFSWHELYRNISFEREAYDNQYDLNYLKSRRRFNFARYIKK